MLQALCCNQLHSLHFHYVTGFRYTTPPFTHCSSFISAHCITTQQQPFLIQFTSYALFSCLGICHCLATLYLGGYRQITKYSYTTFQIHNPLHRLYFCSFHSVRHLLFCYASAKHIALFSCCF